MSYIQSWIQERDKKTWAYFIILLFIYLLLLLININGITLFVGNERIYSSSISALFDGKIDSNTHSLFIETIWYFIVYFSYALTGIDLPIFWRLGTILFSIITLIVFYKISRIFFTFEYAVICTVLLALDPLYFTFSRLLQVEIPVLSLILLSVYYFISYTKKRKQSLFYLSGIFLGLSFAGKFTGVFLLLVMPFIVLSLKKKQKYSDLLTIIMGFFIVIIVAYCVGQGIFFFKSHSENFLQYTATSVQETLQVKHVARNQYSFAWSWFTVPQIIILFREKFPNHISQSIMSFQNPFMMLLTLLSFCLSVILIIKKTKYYKELLCVVFFFVGLYLPWFSNGHTDFYYSSISLIPFSIIMVMFVLLKLPYYKKIIYSLLFLSILSFSFVYPFLVGIKEKQNYENIVHSYSLYKYDYFNSPFCVKCSPFK